MIRYSKICPFDSFYLSSVKSEKMIGAIRSSPFDKFAETLFKVMIFFSWLKPVLINVSYYITDVINILTFEPAAKILVTLIILNSWANWFLQMSEFFFMQLSRNGLRVRKQWFSVLLWRVNVFACSNLHVT